MSEVEYQQEVEEEVAPANDERADLISQISQLREEAKKDHKLDVPIPGYRNLLWARFRPFPVEKTEAKVRQLQQQRGPVLLGSSCDVLIDACEQLMLLPARFKGDAGEDGENLIPIDPVSPVGFDQRAAELFKVPNPGGTARGVVIGLFSTEQAVLGMQVRISQWMQDVTSESDSTLLGN
jgi:hypothetical protein